MLSCCSGLAIWARSASESCTLSLIILDGSSATRSSIPAAVRSISRARTSSPSSAQPSSSMLTASMSANQSKPGMSKGTTPALQAALVTRSGRRAATARLCGPPQEPPLTANRPIPRLSAIAETSATESTTRRPRARFGERARCEVLGLRVQGSCDRVVARIFRRGASPLLRAPVAGEELVGPPAEQERVGALVGLVDERHRLVVEHPHGPSAALESVPAVLIRRAAVSLHHSIDGDLRHGRQFHGFVLSLVVVFLV